MYDVELRRRAQRVLDRLPKADVEVVVGALRELAETPRPRGVEKVRTTGLWRIRQGDYRVVFGIDDRRKIVTVVLVGHRRDVYRSL